VYIEIDKYFGNLIYKLHVHLWHEIR